MPSSLNADNGVVSGTAGLKSSADSSGVLDLQTNGTTAISISASQVVSFANQPTYTGGTANGVMFLNGSKAVTTGTALTFDGTNLSVGAQGEVRVYNTANTRYGRFVTTSAGTLLQSFNGAGEPLILDAPQASAYISFNVNSIEQMRLNTTGLGIGTASPSSKLTVASTGSTIELKQNGTGAATYYVMDNTIETGGKRWRFGYSGAAGIPTFSLFNQTDNLVSWVAEASGNFGIGTASPSRKLDVNGAAVIQSGILNTTSYYETVLAAPYFTNGVANLAVDVRFGNLSFWGYIELEISGTYSNQNVGGKLSKLFAVGTNPGGAIYTNEARVTDCIGATSAGFTIGDFAWDAANSTFRIPIYHVNTLGNDLYIRIKQYGVGGGASAVFSALTLSSLYTSGAIAPISGVNFNTAIGIGGAAAASSGTGITFPATQSASADANTLDDYEEGTWTPSIAGSVGVSGVTAGTHWYRKVGSLVVVTGLFSYTSATAGAAYIVCSVPFPMSANSDPICGTCNSYPYDNNRQAGIVIDNSGGNPNDVYIGFYVSSTNAGNVLWSLSYRST